MNGQSTNALVGPLDSDVAIKSRIFTIRGVQVILDWDIAQLYGVETRVLNQAVKRNLDRFPERFRFVLTKEEMLGLITNCDKFGSKRHPSANFDAGHRPWTLKFFLVPTFALAMRVAVVL